MKIVFFVLLTGSFLFALMPSLGVVDVLSLWDCLLYFLAFTVLSFAIDLAHTLASNFLKGTVLAGHGLSIEAAQYFTPYRNCSFWDVVAEVVGIEVCFFLIRTTVTGWARRPI